MRSIENNNKKKRVKQTINRVYSSSSTGFAFTLTENTIIPFISNHTNIMV